MTGTPEYNKPDALSVLPKLINHMLQMTSSAPRPRTAGRHLGSLLWACLATAAAIDALAAESANAATNTACCNLVELRQYTLKPGRREVFIDLFDHTFANPLDSTGMTVIGEFCDLDNPLRFVWLRGFQNITMRAKELSAFYDGALWRAHRDEANASIVDSDNVLLLEPTSATRRFEALPARTTMAKPENGLVVATLYYTRAETLAAFGALFEHSLRAQLEHAGATTVAEYQTSTQANNFPRLPIRMGEHIFVWIARFSTVAAYTDYKARLALDRQWQQRAWPAAQKYLIRDAEVLRLSPTSRSRLSAASGAYSDTNVSDDRLSAGTRNESRITRKTGALLFPRNIVRGDHPAA